MIDILKTILTEQEIVVDDLAMERMQGFFDDLIEKNRVMDLTNITEPREVALRHFGDSLFLTKCKEFSGKKVLDIGTGAGFPGVPILCAFPDLDITMVDSTTKRIEFINEFLAKEGCFSKATAVAARAEDMGVDKKHRGRYNIVTSRAVAPLNILCELCLPFLVENGVFLAMKSGNEACDLEVAQAKSAIRILGGKVLKTMDYQLAPDCPKRRIVIIKKIAKTPLQYPRKYAKIKSRPL